MVNLFQVHQWNAKRMREYEQSANKATGVEAWHYRRDAVRHRANCDALEAQMLAA